MLETAVKAEVSEAGYKNIFSIKDVFLELNYGEALVITGRSGSGKSTLLKSLLGIIKLSRKGFFRGQVKIAGLDPYTAKPEKLFKTIGYIPQDPWYGVLGHTVETEYCLSFSVLGLPCDPRGLDQYGLGGLRNHITYGLSAGQVQRLLWASNIDKGGKVFFMDEPGVYIDEDGKKKFLNLIEKHLDMGGAAIIVDHDPLLWSKLEPKLLVLENGRVKYFGVFKEKALPFLKTSMLKPRRRKHYDENTEEKLLAENIWFRYPGQEYIIRNTSISIRGGEIIGITGPNGIGKSTLLKLLAGIYRPSKGRIIRSGKTILIPENPLLFFSGATIKEELQISCGENCSEDKIQSIAEEFGIQHILDKPLAETSSGERRRAALASAFLAGYDVFLLDEPSGGLDNYIVINVIESIVSAAERGRAVIIASHDKRLEKIYDKTCRFTEGSLECR
ncbi:MAG: ATP-binding cassette domain-containing protein [Crenarchaeota archaeon]|nr:ATP-binding cassette domain-containing protein [Thermoproteota archaeon]